MLYSSTPQQINISSIRFIQTYAYRYTIEAKKLARHLKLTKGEKWRDFISSLERIHGEVIRELNLPMISETPPVHVSRIEGSELFIVTNGVHSTIAYHELGFPQILAIIEPETYRANPSPKKYLKLDEVTIYDS
ncbi:MAG: hypothetical protein AABX66_03105 [Nanoarchaeota archaeon]